MGYAVGHIYSLLLVFDMELMVLVSVGIGKCRKSENEENNSKLYPCDCRFAGQVI